MCKIPVSFFVFFLYSISIIRFIVVMKFTKNIFPMRMRGSTQFRVLSLWVIIHWKGTVRLVPRAVGFA